MKTNYVLIDYENVQVKTLERLREEHFRIYVFLGPNNTKLHKDLVLAMHEFGDRAQYIELDVSARDALDFHLAYYLGKLSTIDPLGFFHVISKDTGFDPLLRYLKANSIFSARSESIDAMPCFVKAAGNGEVPEPPASRPPSPVAEPDSLMKLVLDDLVKRKTAKPRTPKTLKSTMQARCGSDVSAGQVDALYAALIERQYVRVDGTKLTYSLPEST
jgi:hypothetical protein